jgi:predicted Zn-dependent peptidase
MKHIVTEVILDNGARGLLIHVPDASVMSFQVNFRAGEYLVERDKWETPHIMEHMLLGANKRIPKARAFQAEFEKNGAYSNASTSTYDIIYESECADFEWQRILDWLLVAITEPLFLEEEFKAESGNVREELTSRSNNHFRHLSLALREAFQFYAVTDQERLKLMSNVTIEDIREHYRETHVTSNMRFVIAGNLTPSRKKYVRTAFETVGLNKGRGRRALPREIPKGLAQPLSITNKTVDNYYFYFDTFLKRRMEDHELAAMSLLNSMLTETLYSRILGTARERGLVYSMSSGINAEKYSTNWWFGAQVRPDNAEALFDIMTSELKAVFAGDLDKEEINAAKQYRLGRYQRGAQTVTGIASNYAGRYFFDDVIDDYYEIPNRIKAITKKQLVDGAQALFADGEWGLGVLGNMDNYHELDCLTNKLNSLWDSK